MSLLRDTMKVLAGIIGFFWFVIIVRVLALAGIYESVYTWQLYILLRRFVLIPAIVLAIVSLSLSFATKGKYTRREYITTTKDGDFFSKYTNGMIIVILSYIFFWPLLKGFLFISM